MSAWFARGSARPMLRWLALPMIALWLASGLAPASGAAEPPAAQRASRPPIDPPRVGYPNAMAALGDSISVAFDALPGLPNLGPHPEYAWATGTNATVQTHYQRILQAHPAISGQAFNAAVSGSKVGGLQAEINTLAGHSPEYVTILIGGNDACTDTEGEMTSVSLFRSQFLTATTNLSQLFSDTSIYLASIPDVYNLWAVSHNNSDARSAWSFANICPSMLANPQSTAQSDEDRRQRVRQRVIDYNTQLHEVCAQFIHCRYDNNLVFTTPFSSTDISALDYFHPSVAGQDHLADITYGDTFDFTDSVAPTSTATITPDGALIQVALAGTDDAGLAGIEYRIGGGRWTRYDGPFSVDPTLPVIYRAVDVNGNSEGSHLLEVPTPEPETLVYLPLVVN